MTNYDSIPGLLRKKSVDLNVDYELSERKNCVVKTNLFTGCK